MSPWVCIHQHPHCRALLFSAFSLLIIVDFNDLLVLKIQKCDHLLIQSFQLIEEKVYARNHFLFKILFIFFGNKAEDIRKLSTYKLLLLCREENNFCCHLIWFFVKSVVNLLDGSSLMEFNYHHFHEVLVVVDDRHLVNAQRLGFPTLYLIDKIYLPFYLEVPTDEIFWIIFYLPVYFAAKIYYELGGSSGCDEFLHLVVWIFSR